MGSWHYDESDMERLSTIMTLHGIGFSNDEVKIFAFLPGTGGMSLARRLHILGAYWGFLLMSVHLGLHWNMILGMPRKALKIKSKTKSPSMIAFAAGLVISGYGIWVFISRDFPTCLFLKSEFVFLYYSEPKVLFYIDYLALMGLCIFIAHYSTKPMEQLQKRRSHNGI